VLALVVLSVAFFSPQAERYLKVLVGSPAGHRLIAPFEIKKQNNHDEDRLHSFPLVLWLLLRMSPSRVHHLYTALDR
jgi:hypothetical protein